eukprot:Gb_40052 [translate_table: standard]
MLSSNWKEFSSIDDKETIFLFSKLGAFAKGKAKSYKIIQIINTESSEEVREMVGSKSKEMLWERSKIEDRPRQEDELYTRVPLSRIDKKKLKHIKRSRNGLLGMIDDFNDDISSLVAMEENNSNIIAASQSHPRTEGRRKFKKHKESSDEHLKGFVAKISKNSKMSMENTDAYQESVDKDFKQK